MLQRLEDQLVFRLFEKQIERDVQSGAMSRETATDLLTQLQSLRVYARLQILFYILMMVKRIARLAVPLGTEVITSNLVIEATALTHRETTRILHAPGIMLLRMIPGITICIGNIAILKAEPRLYDVAMRLGEHVCRKLHLRFLIPIYIRPGMKLLRWVYQLE